MNLLHPDLFNILRGYSALVPANTMSFPTHLPPASVHVFLLDSILLNSHFQSYPPSKLYQKSFWKWIIHHLEDILADEDVEIDSRIYDCYMSLLPPSAPALGSRPLGMQGQFCSRGVPLQPPPPQSYITHFWKPSITNSDIQVVDGVNIGQYQTVTLLESRTTIERGTTGLRTWLASLVLSQYLILHPDLVLDKRILELGSGTGFLGIIAASLHQSSRIDEMAPSTPSKNSTALWMTDIDENVLMRCRDNVQLPCNFSSSHPNINYRLLDWSASLDPEMSLPLHSLLHDEINADLILGADIVFDPTLIPALIGVLHLALQPGHRAPRKVALIALTIRNESTLAEFLNAARQSLRIDDLHFQPDHTIFLEVIEGGREANFGVNIYKVTLKGDDV